MRPGIEYHFSRAWIGFEVTANHLRTSRMTYTLESHYGGGVEDGLEEEEVSEARKGMTMGVQARGRRNIWTKVKVRQEQVRKAII